MNWHHRQSCVLILAAAALYSASVLAHDAEAVDNPQPPYVAKSLQGRVVWLAEAMLRLHEIKSVPEAADRILALETDDGQLYPIVEDIRGRAFRRDERLRKLQVELLVRQHRGSPLIQIVRVLEVAEEGRFEIDYWCEICSISMFELKECECCQGPIEFRRQKVMVPSLDD